jgi:putative endonuclease
VSDPPVDPRPARGRLGEALAERFLVSRGYTILERNLRVGRAEIDLVAERGELLVAVEVKWRRAGDFATAPGDAWRAPQRARLHAAILGAMALLPGGDRRPWRIDLVAIEESADGWRLVHRPGAWTPGDSPW